MASQSASKTATKQRSTWTLVEEKEFLILCRELEIAEQLRDKRRCKLFFVLIQLNWKGFQFATLRMKSTKVVTVN